MKNVFATVARTDTQILLSVISRHCYAFNDLGTLTPQGEEDLCHDNETAIFPDRNGEVVTRGRDVWPLKSGTDVVILGKIHAPGGRPRRTMEASTRIGKHATSLIALGPRHAIYRGRGSIAFSEPSPVNEVPLSFHLAYGGIDPMVLPESLQATPMLFGEPIIELFPGAYPRNPSGTGYIVKETPELLDGLLLPQLEDPAQMLRPETLVAGDPQNWWRRPQPQAWGWVHALWFPRCIHAGGRPYYLPAGADARKIPECIAGHVTADQITTASSQQWVRPTPVSTLAISQDVSREACSALRLPSLRGDEWITLHGLSPQGELGLRLTRPEVNLKAWADGSALSEPSHHLHTVSIDCEMRRIAITVSQRMALPESWASVMADKPAISHICKRIAIEVNGVPLSRKQWPPDEVEPHQQGVLP